MTELETIDVIFLTACVFLSILAFVTAGFGVTVTRRTRIPQRTVQDYGSIV